MFLQEKVKSITLQDLKEEIKAMKFRISYNEEEKERLNLRIAELTRHRDTDFIELQKKEKILKKELLQLNRRIEELSPIANLIRKRTSRELGNISFKENQSTVWRDLRNWDSFPSIVREKLNEQKEQIILRKVRVIQGKLEALQSQLEENRKKALKDFERNLLKHKENWESEFQKDLEIEKLKSHYESEAQNLKIKIRSYEIELSKTNSLLA